MNTNAKQFAPLLIVTAMILGAAALAAIEHGDASLWSSRLLWPAFTPEQNRHTPVFSEGTFIPPIIQGSKTFTAKDNPIIFAGNVTIPAGSSLSFGPGAHIYAHEFATITIDGSLTATGSNDHPVLFTTNELHELNQTWNGLVLRAGGSAEITNTEIKHASVAVSCLAQSKAIIQSTKIFFASTGIYTESENCVIRNSAISHVLDGIIAKSVSAHSSNNIISASRRDITEINP